LTDIEQVIVLGHSLSAVDVAYFMALLSMGDQRGITCPTDQQQTGQPVQFEMTGPTRCRRDMDCYGTTEARGFFSSDVDPVFPTPSYSQCRSWQAAPWRYSGASARHGSHREQEVAQLGEGGLPLHSPCFPWAN
jgi:hypothetical protein